MTVMAKCESILWLPRKLKKKKVLLCKSVKIYASFFTRKFHNGFYHSSPDHVILFHRNFISKCLPGRWWTPTAQLLLLGRTHVSSLTCFFWSPNKNSSTTSFKLKGKEVFPPAGRLLKWQGLVTVKMSGPRRLHASAKPLQHGLKVSGLHPGYR